MKINHDLRCSECESTYGWGISFGLSNESMLCKTCTMRAHAMMASQDYKDYQAMLELEKESKPKFSIMDWFKRKG